MIDATETANAGSDASVGYLTSSKLTLGVESLTNPTPSTAPAVTPMAAMRFSEHWAMALAPGTIPATE
jgi:hypothetical protein